MPFSELMPVAQHRDEVDAAVPCSKHAEAEETRPEASLKEGANRPPEDDQGSANVDDDVRVPQGPIDETLTDPVERLVADLQSLEERTAALLSRAFRGSTRDTLVPPQSPHRKENYDEVTRKRQPGPEASRPDINPDPVFIVPMALANLMPRSQPPEAGQLGAMRELAANQARSAIDTHHRNSLLKKALNSGTAAFACLAGTVVALTCEPILGQSMRVGRMVAVVASVYFLSVFFVSAKNWATSLSASTNEQASE